MSGFNVNSQAIGPREGRPPRLAIVAQAFSSRRKRPSFSFLRGYEDTRWMYEQFRTLPPFVRIVAEAKPHLRQSIAQSPILRNVVVGQNPTKTRNPLEKLRE